MKFIALTLALLSIEIQSQPNYIGGNSFNNFMNNPNQIDKFLQDVHGELNEACKTIPSVGKAVLSLRQVQQAIGTLLDSSN